jgi:hypothetical protein
MRAALIRPNAFLTTGPHSLTSGRFALACGQAVRFGATMVSMRPAAF